MLFSGRVPRSSVMLFPCMGRRHKALTAGRWHYSIKLKFSDHASPIDTHQFSKCMNEALVLTQRRLLSSIRRPRTGREVETRTRERQSPCTNKYSSPTILTATIGFAMGACPRQACGLVPNGAGARHSRPTRLHLGGGVGISALGNAPAVRGRTDVLRVLASYVARWVVAGEGWGRGGGRACRYRGGGCWMQSHAAWPAACQSSSGAREIILQKSGVVCVVKLETAGMNASRTGCTLWVDTHRHTWKGVPPLQ